MAFQERLDFRTLLCLILIALATLFQLIGLGSDNWVDTMTENWGMVGSSGLWRSCADWASIDTCRGFVWTDNQVSHWFRTVQTMEVLGFVFGGVALLMMILYVFVETCTENKRLKAISILLLALSFVLVLSAGIVVGALKDVQKSMKIESYARLSWGFGLSIVASILYLASALAVAIV